MNVTPIIQNNNSLSFGMALKLKNQGAKEVATLLENVSPNCASYIENNLLKSIHASKTNVIYDGKDLVIRANAMDVPAGLWRFNKEGTADMIVSAEVPVKSSKSMLIYEVENSSGNTNNMKIIYHPLPKRYIFGEEPPLLQKLFNANEIVKELDACASKRAYEEVLENEKQIRIDESVKKLTDLYG